MLNLVIIGGSKKGKTLLLKSLNRKLKNDKFPADEICIYNWQCSSPGNDGLDVTFRMWDFPSKVSYNHKVKSLYFLINFFTGV